MPIVRSEVRTPSQVTLIVGEGVVTAAEIQAAAFEFHENHPTPLVLWDCRDADFSSLSLRDLSGLFTAISPLVKVRSGGKTAILVNSQVGFGIGRWAATLAELAGFNHPIRPFLSHEAAIEWLSEAATGSPAPGEDTGAA